MINVLAVMPEFRESGFLCRFFSSTLLFHMHHLHFVTTIHGCTFSYFYLFQEESNLISDVKGTDHFML